MSDRLLREYIRTILKEEGGDHSAFTPGAIMAAGAAMSPYGMHYGSSDDMYKIFVKPFTDVFDTAVGKTKELSVKAQTTAKVAFEAVATSLIPVLGDSYSEIFEKEQHAIEKIKQEYAEVYKANWDAFKDNDVLAASFMYSPTAFLTIAFARKSPKIAAQMISALSGGKLDSWLHKLSKKMQGFDWWGDSSKPTMTGLGRRDDGPGMPFESKLHEDEDKGSKIAELLASEKVKKVLQQSSVVQSMQKQGQAVVRNTLEQVFKQAQAALTSRSFQELQQRTGAKLKGLEKLQQIPPQERQKLEQAVLSGAKKSLKEFYVKNLSAQAKKAVEAGVPEDSQYVQDYKRVVQKIEAL